MGSTEQPQIVRFNQINPEHPELNSPESPQLRKKTGRSKIKSKNLPKRLLLYFPSFFSPTKLLSIK